MAYLIDLNSVIMQWQSIGIFDIFLPMILIFAIIFAILQRTKVLGEANKGIDAIVAMAISLFAILNPMTSQFLRVVFENTVIGISILVAALLLIGLVMQEKKKWWIYFSGFAGLAVFLWILSRIADYYELYYGVSTFLSRNWLDQNIGWILALVVLAIFAIIVMSSGNKNDTGQSKGLKMLEELFKEED